MKSYTSRKGFTIIEMIVVIAIIALLTGIILTSLTGSKAKSRDATRISDLNQIQLALEQYFDRCGQYPSAITGDPTIVTNGCPSGINFGSFISVVPTDPSTKSSFTYAINTQNVQTTPPTDYILYTKLEGSNAAQQNSYTLSAQTSDMKVGNWTVSPSGSFSCYNPSNSSADYNYCISTH